MDDITHGLNGLSLEESPPEVPETSSAQPQEAVALEFDDLDAFRVLAEDQYTACKTELECLRLSNQQLELQVGENMQALT